MASPIGLFGGTFDPVHFGHLRLAAELHEACGLSRVVFLPAGRPWQRENGPFASAADRVRMLELATAEEPAFTVDTREVRRERPTYTVETLESFRAEAGPATPIVFLCGTDAFAGVTTWHRWESLFDLAHFAVAVRAEDDAWHAKGAGAVPAALRERLCTDRRDVLESPAGRIMTFAMTPLAISSTAIRRLNRAGASIRFLTPDPVVGYIHRHSLYGQSA